MPTSTPIIVSKEKNKKYVSRNNPECLASDYTRSYYYIRQGMALETEKIKNMLTEATTWPEAAIIIVGIICLASVIIGQWPWQRDIYHQCDCNKDGEEDGEK